MSVDAGRTALADGRWAEARAIFEDLLVGEQSRAAPEDLGVAARWLHDEPTAVCVGCRR